jgi:hypothetical protein
MEAKKILLLLQADYVTLALALHATRSRVHSKERRDEEERLVITRQCA